MPTKPYTKYTLKEDDLKIIILLSNGETVGDIAIGWGCSQHAMAVRLVRLRENLNVDTNEHLVATAFRNNWIK